MVDHIHHEVWQHQIRKTDGRVTMKKKKIKGKLIDPCYAYCENGCMEWFENEFEIDEFGHFFDLKYKSMYDNTLPSNNKKSRE